MSDSPARNNLDHFSALKRVVLDGAMRARSIEAVRAKAHLLALDTLACVLSGRRAPQLQSLEKSYASTAPESFRFPGGEGISELGASAIAASASAWDEACEGLPYAHGRPGLALMGALWPLAVRRNASVDQLIDALIAGYEAGGRAGGWLRIRPGMHVDGNWPAIGVAAGVGLLLGLSPEQRWSAVCAVACQLPMSLYAPIRSGDNIRNLYPAHSAWLGLMAVDGALAGIGAPESVFTEIAEQFALPDGREAPEDSRVLLMESYFKPHAGVRHAHYGLEAAIQIRDELQGRTESISAIRLSVYDEAIRYAGNRNPQAPITGQFSLSLGVAAGLRFGEMSPELFQTGLFHDAELRRLEALVSIEPDAEAASSGIRAAELHVASGQRSLHRRVTQIAGDPSRPPSSADIFGKFIRYSSKDVSAQAAARFCEELTSESRKSTIGDAWHRLLRSSRTA